MESELEDEEDEEDEEDDERKQVPLNDFDRRPTWTFAERMGQTTTELPDGRLVFIGGEHENFYDPDFHIYNDVCVYDKNKDSTASSNGGAGSGSGSAFAVNCYPPHVFPPTNFHTATLVKGTPYIYVISCTGGSYGRERKTPVYRLDTRDFLHACREDVGGEAGLD